jgi:predicted nucleotidyltransferase
MITTTLKKIERNGVYLDYKIIEQICKKYHISELSLFGSVLRDDFREDSDIDILLVWEDYKNKNNRWDFVYIVDEFKKLLGREVDVIDKEELTNPVRREDILSSLEVVYATQ